MCRLIFILFFCSLQSFSQGKLLIIGGGTERSGTQAWNYLPYQWAVEQSENKKVANHQLCRCRQLAARLF
ncbi:MAG: hypothetical protein HC842_08750 [Cytophagales bacterium]|nr:hypothetical protein [Cytophagales bacterium]